MYTMYYYFYGINIKHMFDYSLYIYKYMLMII